MQDIKKTSKEHGHNHLIFVTDEGGVTTVDKGHQHRAFVNPETGGLELEPAEDGHSHSILDLPAARAEKKEDEADIIADVMSLARSWYEQDKKNITRGREADEFYEGRQWADSDKSALEAMGRACLTLNKVQKNIDELCGHELQNRRDLRYMPQEGGDQLVCDMLNHLSKDIFEQNYFDRERSKVFKDISITGRGTYNLYMSFENDLRGEIKIERFPWDQVLYGPHEKEDLSDCEGLVKHRMYSIQKLKQLYPDKAEDVQSGYDDMFLDKDERHTTYASGQYAKSDNTSSVLTMDGLPLVDGATKEIRVFECWRRIYKRVPVIANPDMNFYFSAEMLSMKEARRMETLPGFYVVEQPISGMRITRVAGHVLLADENPAKVPINDFFAVPVYATKRGDSWWGKVAIAVDAQREINKRHSQAIDIGNKMTAYGWFYDDNTFPDHRDLEEFKAKSTSPGFVVKVGNVAQPPQKVEGTKFPSEIVELMAVSDQNLTAMMNIQAPISGANQSGVHYQEQQRARLVGNEFLFDNMSFALKRVGKLILSLIQKYYSADRIYRILNSRAAKESFDVANRPFSEYSEEEIITLLETQDLARYDVVVSESSWGPTARATTLQILSELAKQGMPIPPDILIRLMDMPEEERTLILQGMQQQQESAAGAEDKKYQMEIDKTLIAHGHIPPSVQSQLGQQPQQGAPAQPMAPDTGAMPQ